MTNATAKNRIRELRQKLGLTAKNLAERAGTTEATISRIESGKQSLSQSWLQKIARALGVQIVELLGNEPGIGAHYVPVVATIENGKWLEEHFYKADQIYGVPVTGYDRPLELSAFEWIDTTKGRILAAELSKLQAANYIGKPFVVYRVDQSGQSELSLRILEHRPGGLYLVSKKDDLAEPAVRLDDENVTMVWRVLEETRIY